MYRRDVEKTARLPSVAVSIPTYNQAEYLPTAVRSAYDQDYDGHLEVWVADDASTDGTHEVLHELLREFSDLKVIQQEQNVGIARNATAALRAPSTEFVVRLDSDDVLEPAFVSSLVGLMRGYPGAGYSHPSVQEIDQYGHERRVRRLARGTGFQPADAALRASLSGHRTAANIMLFRKSALEAVAYYDGRPEYVEDYDLSVRLADNGYGNIYTEEVLARYRVWNDARGVRARRKELQLEGYRRIFDETISPAWRRRGWGAREISRQRTRLALRNCPSCFAPNYTSAEQHELVDLLLRLGDSRRLRIRLALCRRGFAPAYARVDSLPYRAKDLLKALWSGMRKHRVLRPEIDQ